MNDGSGTSGGQLGRFVSSRSATVFAVALGLRLLHLAQLRGAPFFPLKMGDALSYHDWARAIAAGDWIGAEVFYQAPLYPYFLGAVYALAGEAPLTARLVQAVFGSLACVLVAGAGARFFASPRVGTIAGLLLAIHPGALFFDALFQKSVLDAFLFALLLWILGGVEIEPRRASLLGAGAALGLLVLVRENALAFVGAILLWLVMRWRERGPERLVLAGVFLAGVAAVLLPVAARNLLVGGELHLTTAQFGTALYMGNNPRADGLHQPLVPFRDNPLHERHDATEIAERARGHELSPQEVSDYWKERALGFIRQHPADWLKLTLRKFALFWNRVEIVDTEDIYTHAEWSVPLRASTIVLHFGVLAPLAALGVWVSWPVRSRLWLLHLLVASYVASVLVFFIFGRYRHALVPALVLFAAAGLEGLARFVKERPRRVVLAGFAFVVAVAVFANWPATRIHPTTDVDSMRAATRFNIAAALALDGRQAEAIPHYREALEIRPTHALARYGLGHALHAEGRYEEAAESYRACLELTPDFAPARFALCLSQAAMGDEDGARSCYEAVLHIDPQHLEAHTNLGNLLQQRGDLVGAIRHYVDALRIDPASAAAHFNLAVALGRQGREVEAIGHLEDVLRIDPTHAAARSLLDRLRSGGAGPGSPPP